MTATLSQRGRLVVLALYVGLFLVLCKLALGQWLPPATPEGLWFYSGIAALLLGAFLTSPHFTKPADALPNAVAAAFALLPVAVPPTVAIAGVGVLRWIALTQVSLVILLAILAMWFANSEEERGRAVSLVAWRVSGVFGAPRVLFSVVFVYALWAFHSDSVWELLVLGTGWVFMISGRPIENAIRAGQAWLELRHRSVQGSLFGSVVGRQIPDIVIVKHPAKRGVESGDILIVGSDDHTPELAVALDHVGTADGRLLRCAVLPLPRAQRIEWTVRAGLRRIEPDDVWHLGRNPDPPVPADAVATRDAVVGIVAPDTDIAHLRFEIVRDDTDIAEGDLVSVRVGSKKVLYQVLNGLTKEEIVQQKNTRGFVTSHARKVGIWNAAAQRLETVAWLPAPNAIVTREMRHAASATWQYAGYLPHTTYGVAPDPHALVTHSTAILGVLGSGKSLLACELVERMVERNITVVILDLSGQYATELAPFRDSAVDDAEDAQLQADGVVGRTAFRANAAEGGSIRQFKQRLRQQFAAQLAAGGPRRVRIMNPARFDVWRQDGKLYSGSAPMAHLTAPEITRCVAEALLDCASNLGMIDGARCCLVLEEAHSLVPEFNAIAHDSDKAATNGTAKAILQGRKYGFGCLLVTQRTANVTKSILNQCNTIFALQVFDATGMEFLRNYIGDDHAKILSALAPRHAVVYGRGLSCATPVVIKLNDRPAFIAGSPLRQSAVTPSGEIVPGSHDAPPA